MAECTLHCMMDIDASKEHELELRRKAERDLLTGLYNKVTTEQMIKNFEYKTQESEERGAFKRDVW